MNIFTKQQSQVQSASRTITIGKDSTKRIEVTVRVVDNWPNSPGWGKMNAQEKESSILSTVNWAMDIIIEHALINRMQVRPEEITK
jgi:hypothetical protein